MTESDRVPLGHLSNGGKMLGRRLRLAAAVVAMLSALGSGCVERRMTIRTNPPGALAYVDDHEVGITPVSTSFIYYGDRKIRLVKDGYETLTVLQPVPTPWYEIPPADFISETFVPGKVHDQRTFDYQLRPQTVVPTDQLMSRAEALRRGTQSAAAGAGAPGLRVNVPPQRGPAMPGPGFEAVPAPAPAGGQPTYPLPPAEGIRQ